MTSREVNSKIPNVARIYDSWLGGTENFEADRSAATSLAEISPMIVAAARSNRQFLGRVVRYLVKAGIRQFIDIGTGLPTQGNIHEIAQKFCPDARVVYSDFDPVCVSHARALLASDRVMALQADIRSPEQILGNRDVRKLIDFNEPTAILMIAVLHFVPEKDDPFRAVAQFRDALPAGSYLAISHGTYDGFDPNEDRQASIRDVYADSSASLAFRTHSQVRRLFGDLQMVDPGLVWIPQWRPDGPDEIPIPDASALWGGVGKKC